MELLGSCKCPRINGYFGVIICNPYTWSYISHYLKLVGTHFACLLMSLLFGLADVLMIFVVYGVSSTPWLVTVTGPGSSSCTYTFLMTFSRAISICIMKVLQRTASNAFGRNSHILQLFLCRVKLVFVDSLSVWKEGGNVSKIVGTSIIKDGGL